MQTLIVTNFVAAGIGESSMQTFTRRKEMWAFYDLRNFEASALSDLFTIMIYFADCLDMWWALAWQPWFIWFFHRRCEDPVLPPHNHRIINTAGKIVEWFGRDGIGMALFMNTFRTFDIFWHLLTCFDHNPIDKALNIGRYQQQTLPGQWLGTMKWMLSIAQKDRRCVLSVAIARTAPFGSHFTKISQRFHKDFTKISQRFHKG